MSTLSLSLLTCSSDQEAVPWNWQFKQHLDSNLFYYHGFNMILLSFPLFINTSPSLRSPNAHILQHLYL